MTTVALAPAGAGGSEDPDPSILADDEEDGGASTDADPTPDGDGPGEGASEITLFDGGQFPRGDLGSRATTTAECSSAVPEGLGCPRVVALLSYAEDAIAGLPVNHGVPTDRRIRSANGTTIADDWDDFLDGDWDACLATNPGPQCTVAAGVLPDLREFWHGSSFAGDGTLGSNCTDWTVATDAASGHVGVPFGDGIDPHFPPFGNFDAPCDFFAEGHVDPHLVCLCY